MNSHQKRTDLFLYYKNKIWFQFLLIVKADVLKQQISKFYPQILSTKASDHIYYSQRLFINVKVKVMGPGEEMEKDRKEGKGKRKEKGGGRRGEEEGEGKSVHLICAW